MSPGVALAERERRQQWREEQYKYARALVSRNQENARRRPNSHLVCLIVLPALNSARASLAARRLDAARLRREPARGINKIFKGVHTHVGAALFGPRPGRFWQLACQHASSARTYQLGQSGVCVCVRVQLGARTGTDTPPASKLAGERRARGQFDVEVARSGS